MNITKPTVQALQATQQVFDTGVAVTPSDTAAVAFSALYVGGAGNVKVDTPFSTGVTFTGVPAGALLPVQVTKVYATGTTATSIVGLS